MELVDRYLKSVGSYLPKAQKDDILRELSENIRSEIEDQEKELGRPLTEGEMIDWLKELGPPREMAARYQLPRYLIGPTIFPMYWNILRLVAIWASIAYAISIAARLIVESHDPEWVAAQVAGYPWVVISAAAWVTGIFALLEFLSQHYPDKCPDFLAPASCWSPLSLPPLQKQPAAGTKPPNLLTLSAELVVRFALIVWLLLIPRYPFLLLGPSAAYLKNGPVVFLAVVVWFYWSVVALNAVPFVWEAFNILADRWQQKSTLKHLVTEALGLVPIAILIAAPGQLYLAGNPLATHTLPGGLTLAALNHFIFTGFVIVGFIKVAQFAWELWKAGPGAHTSLLRVLP